MDRVYKSIGCGLVMVCLAGPWNVWAQDGAGQPVGEPAFRYQERTTVHTIGLTSMAEDSLSDTVIEGGLSAPAAGVPVATSEENFYLDPLALQPNDSRTDLGRSEIPADIRFSNPRNIPGQVHGNNYAIQPPTNRTYGSFGASVSER